MRALLICELILVYTIAASLATIRPDLIPTMLLVSIGATYLVGWSLDLPATYRAWRSRRAWRHARDLLPLVRFAALLEHDWDVFLDDIADQIRRLQEQVD